MTARPLAPVIPSSAVPAARQRARAAAGRRLPLAEPAPVPSLPEDMVDGVGRIDASSRRAGRRAPGRAGGRVVKSWGRPLPARTAAPASRPPVPTFAEYVPVVAATVTPGTLRAYRPYWKRTVEQWGERRLDEPTPSEVKQLVACVKANAVQRRNRRGGPNAAENPISARGCPAQRA